MRRRLRRYRLRHKIHAIKTRPNNPLRFLQRKKSFQRYLSNDLTCAARKTTFRTRKRFHNKQYTPKSKDQPFESERTHFDTGFNNGSIAMHRPTFFCFSSAPNHNRSIKNQNKITSNNHNKQSEKTIRNLSIKNTPKTNRQNKHEKLSHQSNVKSITQTITTKITHTISQSKTRSKQTQQAITKKCNVLNIKISQTATCFELTEIAPLIKTQYNRKKQNNRADTLR